MKAQFEVVPTANSSFLVFRRAEPSFAFNWHYHPEFELTLIEAGAGQRLVGDCIQDYEPGDLVLLGANLPHTWKSDSPSSGRLDGNRAVVVQFRAEHLGKGLLELGEMEPVRMLLERSSRGLWFEKARRNMEIADEIRGLLSLSPARRTLTLISILLSLAESKSAEALASGRHQPLCSPGEEKRINKICRLLDRNSSRKISYESVSKEMHMDISSLCRLFKRSTGRTMTEYVNEIRISHAARLLIDTDMSALEIAMAVGFSNYSNFCRQFKKVRFCSPRSLRQMFKDPANYRSRP